MTRSLMGILLNVDAPPTHGSLQWVDNRWHCYGKGIHAGCQMEIRDPASKGPWTLVHIESEDQGRRLIACRVEHGITWRTPVAQWHKLRWRL